MRTVLVVTQCVDFAAQRRRMMFLVDPCVTNNAELYTVFYDEVLGARCYRAQTTLTPMLLLSYVPSRKS